jgi:glycosyltransferase involved in cell wall biosynthesis
LRILILIHSLTAGGAERVTAMLANHWVGQGHDVTVATIAQETHDHYAVDPRTHRVTLGLGGESRGALQAIKGNLRRLAALRGILRRTNPDVALGMMSTPGALLALAGRGLGIPVVCSERIHPPKLPLGRAWETVRRLAYPRAACVVAQTQASAEWLRSNLKCAHVVVIPNAVEYPLPELSPRVEPPQRDGTRWLLSVGRAAPQKDFDRLIRIFAQLAGDFPRWNLAILGDGQLREALLGRVAHLGLSERIVLPGTVGNVGEWYARADLFALTSRFEGFPNVLIEALAHGVPAVSVDCETGPRDVLRNGIDGILVPLDDDQALRQALARLMTDDALRDQYAMRAAEARQRFSIERVSGEWLRLFESLRRDR